MVARYKIYFIACLIIVLLTACDQGEPTRAPAPTSTSGPIEATEIAQTATPAPSPSPTSTPVPLAALVNGDPITLAEYQIVLSQFQAALPLAWDSVSSQDEGRVIEELIDELLLAQAAYDSGYSLDESALQARISELAQEAAGQTGEADALAKWQAQYGYTTETFRVAFARSLAAAWMRDQIIAAVPAVAEQVHARQILLYNESEADLILAQVRAGIDFATLAEDYDPTLAGDIGWFSKGYLSQPAIEEAAFSLQPGEISPVIQTDLGYHIVQVIERSSEKALAPGAHQALQLLAIRRWLDDRRSQSEIQVLLPES